jgi:adenine/guanine phosphoribosyltransferase-like PRPP-binding protein
MRLTSPYLEEVYDPVTFKKLVAKTAKKVKEIKRKFPFTHIAFRGSSGAAMAFPVSVATGIPLVHVRKLREKSHGCPIEGRGTCNRYVILDDFICSGETVNAIANKLEKACCVGIITYLSDRRDQYTLTVGRRNKTVPVFSI